MNAKKHLIDGFQQGSFSVNPLEKQIAIVKVQTCINSRTDNQPGDQHRGFQRRTLNNGEKAHQHGCGKSQVSDESELIDLGDFHIGCKNQFILPSMKSISIIIITYNRAADTLQLLKNIAALDSKANLLRETIVLNNASGEDYEIVKTYMANTPDMKGHYVDAPENLGVSRGRNYAAALATGDYFLFLDDDVAIEDAGLLEAVIRSFQHPTPSERPLGVLACKVRYFANREIQVNAFPHKQFARYKDLPWFFTGYYVGCAHVISRQAWQQAGNYPEDFFYGMEEYDLSYRILDLGYTIAYTTAIEIFHKESPEGRRPKSIQLRMMWVNKSIVAWRYLPVGYFFSTAIAWSFFFLLRSRLSLFGWIKGWGQVLQIPFRQSRHSVKPSTLEYLRQVKARLWY